MLLLTLSRSTATRQGFHGSGVFSKPHGSGGIGSVQEVLKSHGSGRVGSGRVGTSRVKRFRNLAGRVGSGQEVLKSRGSGQVGSGGFQISRVGSSHDPRGMGHYTDRATLTREFLSSDPRVGP